MLVYPHFLEVNNEHRPAPFLIDIYILDTAQLVRLCSQRLSCMLLSVLLPAAMLLLFPLALIHHTKHGTTEKKNLTTVWMEKMSANQFNYYISNKALIG